MADADTFATARSALASSMTDRAAHPQTGFYSFTFTGDGCGGLCPKSGCYQEELDCEYCLESWHAFPPDASYVYDDIVSGGCAGTKVTCAECEGMMGLSRYDLPSVPVEETHIDTFATARSALASAMKDRTEEATESQTGYYSFTFTGDGCGGQCPTSGCYQEELDCEYCLESWHAFPPDASYVYDDIVSGGCAGTKTTCAECQGMMGLSRYDLPSDSFASARSALTSAVNARTLEAARPQTGYYSFTFTGDGCGGQCPTSGCYQEELDCEYCLESWHAFPPDASYVYDDIVSGGCAGTKTTCAECQGMMGLSRYDLPSDSFAAARSALSSANAKTEEATRSQTGYYSFTFTGDGCGGQCPTSGCYQEELDCEYCLESWHAFPPDASYVYDDIVSGGCAGTKTTCAECQGMMGLSRYDLPSDDVVV